jgi:predicted TIM-barrel fold metal-dependent hydrolase
MRVVDSHFHVWRQADLPWLSGPMQPRIFGPYEAIRRDYPIGEYLSDIAGAGVEKAVYVQANWPADRAEDEAAWIEGLAAETGWPHAIVGYADMGVEDARPALDRLARFPRLRGIRQQLHWHENPLYRFAAGPDLCRDERLRRNVGRLADYGFSFDLQVFPGQMDGACELADACPATTFVLQHAGMPEDTTDEGHALWRERMAALARRPNVVSKLSGLGTFLHRLDAEHVRRVVA